jgi:hypothetical protein
MVIENNNIRKSNNDGSRIGNDVDLSIYYKYLKGLSTDEVIGIFDTVGVAIDCKYCGYIYVDKGKKTLHTCDFSTCPRCKGFIKLPVQTCLCTEVDIDAYIDDDLRRRRKKHAVIMERECNAIQQAVAFLLRPDFPDEMLVNIMLDDGDDNGNGSNKVYTFLNRKDALSFLYEEGRKWKKKEEEKQQTMKVTVTMY